jgi:hypothetical protein
LAFASALAMCGCGAGHETAQSGLEVSRLAEPIIGGAPSGTAEDSVVVLATFDAGVRKSLCSATVVAPNLVITARHCVSDADGSTACTMAGTPVTGGTLKGDRDPKNLLVFVGQAGVAPNTEVEANASARGAALVVDPSTTVCNDDVAFVLLDTRLAAPIAPLRLGPPALAEKVAVVGWGIDQSGSLPTSREARAGVALIGIGPAPYPDNAEYGYGDHEFMLGESACAGDSGSPALASTGAITGVAARAGNGTVRDPNNYASTCMGPSAHAVYTHLASKQDLVTRAFAAAGEPVWLEGAPDPRAPKAEPAVAEEPASSTEETTAADLPAAPTDPPGGPTRAAAGGCTMVPEPQPDAVGHAAGFAAMLALIMRLRRRRSDDAPLEE